MLKRILPAILLMCCIVLVAQAAWAEPRTALVIGNNAYPDAPLANAVNDSRDMRYALTQVGFEVIYLENATKQQIETAIQTFGETLARKGGAGLFYYAGHGLQMDGVNYLVPVDTVINSASDVRYGCVGAERVLGKMQDAGNQVNIVIMDACRDNPFLADRSGDQPGLAEMSGPIGSFIGYATSPGYTASDGDGDNGLYTKHILRNIFTPGMKVEDVFKQVRVGVVNESGRQQVPWDHTSMMGDFYFVVEGGTIETNGQQVAVTPDFSTPEFSPGKKQAHTLPDGSVLKGDFNDNGDGFGVLTWTDGGNYVGDFVGGMMHGNGVITWPEGAVYQGQFVDHKMHGQGRIAWPDGTAYEGLWYEGYAAGGWFTWGDGAKEWARQDASGNYEFPCRVN